VVTATGNTVATAGTALLGGGAAATSPLAPVTGLLSTGALGGATGGGNPAGALTSAAGTVTAAVSGATGGAPVAGLTGGSGTGALSKTGGVLAPVTTTLGSLVK
ncbi:hypothetical protein A8D95_38145, partial [Burkholderia cenocepacia]